MAGILEGIRVLEWTGGHPGPYGAVCLADLGAEVIRIEEVDERHSARQTGNFLPRFRRQQLQRGDRSYDFETDNRNKKSIALDLKQPAGREIVYRLVAKSDVFLASLRREPAFRLGIDRATLLGYNPRLIYAHVSALGDEGEEEGRHGTGTAIASRLGLLMYDRLPNTRPADSLTSGYITDQMGGVSTAYGVLAALIARERLGIVQEVDTSILGGTMWALYMRYRHEMSMGTPLSLSSERAPVPGGRRFKTKDGKWLTVGNAPGSFFTSQKAQWPNICKALGLEELSDDPRFKDRQGQMDNAEEMVHILTQAFAQKDSDELRRLFKQLDVDGAIINTPLEAINDPQVLANEYVVEYDHPYLGKVKYPGCPAKFSETPAQVRGVAPSFGEHTTPVLHELAGYSLEEIEALRKQRVIR